MKESFADVLAEILNNIMPTVDTSYEGRNIIKSNSIDRETQTKKPYSINNQKGHLGGQIVSLIFAITIWGLYIMAAVQSVKSFTKLLKSNESKDLLSLSTDLMVFPGFLILSILAGFIHAYIIHQRIGEEFLEVVDEFLGFILALVTAYLFKNPILFTRWESR